MFIMKDSISRDNTFDIMKCIGIYAMRPSDELCHA